MVSDPEPARGANPDLSEPAICTVLSGNPGIVAKAAAGDVDRTALASRWCADKPIDVSVAQDTEVQRIEVVSYCGDLIKDRKNDVVAEDRALPVLLVAGLTRVAIAEVDGAYEIRYSNVISAESEENCPNGSGTFEDSESSYVGIALKVSVRHQGGLVFSGALPGLPLKFSHPKLSTSRTYQHL